MLGVCVVLLLLVIVVFAQTAYFQFVNFDDQMYVLENQHVRQGLSSSALRWAFTSLDAHNWHPLTWLSHMLDWQLYGLDYPGGHHAANVMLHVAVVILLFLVLWRMTDRLWPSAVVAAVFAIHPLRVESVAWISERKDVLSALFFMLTLAAYLGYTRRPFSLVRYLAVVLLFALGLMAKPMIVTLPCVLLLLDYWPLGRWDTRPRWRLVVEKLPLFALSVASCVVTSIAQRTAAASLEVIGPASRIANALVAYATYVGQLVYPVGLAAFYPHPGDGIPAWKAIVATVVLAAITLGAVVWRRRFPYWFVGWFWYVGMLVPVIGLVQVGAHAMADRYTYLPGIGLLVALVWGAAQAVVSWPDRRVLCGVASALALMVLTACAWQQTSYWRDSETLWTRTLACTSHNPLALTNFGNYLKEHGHTDRAFALWEEAIAAYPTLPEANNSLGMALAEQGKWDAAIEHYKMALLGKPGYANALANLGNAMLERGDFDAAIAYFREALHNNPEFADAHNALGNALLRHGDVDAAIAEYRAAIAIRPELAQGHYNLGMALAKRGDLNAAIACYQKALQVDPGHVESQNNWGTVLARRGELDAAIDHFRLATKIDPDYAEAHYNLGTALLQKGKTAETISEWRQAARLQPDRAELVNQLAWMLATANDASVRDGREAVALARHAVELSGGRQPAILDTLAAAYAEAGQFSDALSTARQARNMAAEQHNPALAESIRARILLYEAKTPFHAGKL